MEFNRDITEEEYDEIIKNSNINLDNEIEQTADEVLRYIEENRNAINEKISNFNFVDITPPRFENIFQYFNPYKLYNYVMKLYYWGPDYFNLNSDIILDESIFEGNPYVRIDFTRKVLDLVNQKQSLEVSYNFCCRSCFSKYFSFTIRERKSNDRKALL